MKNVLLATIILALAFTAFARDAETTTYQALMNDFSDGRISVDTYVENLILSVKAPENLAPEYRGLITGYSGTLPLIEAYNHLEELSDEAAARLRPMMSRPYGLSQTYSTTHFKFHYTTSGGDATTTSFVSQMGTAFENSWTHIVAMGFATPPSDGSGGGDSKYDVYIRNLSSGILGYCEPESNVPATSWNDATSFINMRNSYSAYSYTPVQLMQSTAVHELFHGFQMGYDASESPWFMEVSSVWIEDDMYPTYDDEHAFLSDFFNNPDVTITTYNGSHEYGSYHLATYLTDEFGVGTMFEIWDECKWVTVLAAIQGIASDHGSSRNAAFTEFFQWNLFTGSRAGLGHYDEGADFPSIHIEDVVYPSDYPVTGGGSSHWPDHLASNYFQLNIPGGASGPFSISFDGADGGVWSAQVIFPGTSTYSFLDIPLDAYGYGYITIEDSIYSTFSDVYLVVGMLSTSGNDWHFSYSAVFDTIVPSYNPPRNLVATSGVAGSVPLVWDPPVGGGTGGEEEIFYDDGVGAVYYPSSAFGSTNITEYVKFTHTAPCTLITAKFTAYSASTYSNVGVRVWGESGTDSPGIEVGTARSTLPTGGVWTEYDLSSENIALPAGDFFIGIDRSTDGETGIPADDSTTVDRSFAIVDDSLLYTIPSDYMIRAVVKAGARCYSLAPGGRFRPLNPMDGYAIAGVIDAPVLLDEPVTPPEPRTRPTETPTNYIVYRSNTMGGPWTTAIAYPTTEEYDDMAVTDGNTYYYVVKAQYAGGNSGPSNQASATPGAGSGPDSTGYELIMNADTAAMSLGIWMADGWAEVLHVDNPAKLISLVYAIYTTGSGAYRPGLHHWQDNRIVGELLPRIEEDCGGSMSDTGWTYYVYDVELYDQFVNGDFVVSMRQVVGNEFIVHEPVVATDNEFLYNDSLDFWYHPDTGVFYIGAIVEYVDTMQLYTISGNVFLAGGSGGSPPPSDLSGSIVSIQSLGIAETTDASGYYEIDSLEPGTYMVSASRIWYDPLSELISVGNDVVRNFNLIPFNLPVNPPRFVSARSFEDGQVTLNWLGPVGSPGTEEWLIDWEPDSMYWYRAGLSSGSVECHMFSIWAPCSLKTVRIAFYDSVGTYDNIDFHIWADDGSGFPDFTDDMITPVNISPTPYSPTAGFQFTMINLDSLGRDLELFPGERIHVGVEHITSHPSIIQDNTIPMATPTPSKIYDASSGMWDTEMTDFLIEAYAEYFEYAGRPMPPDAEVSELRRHNRFASRVPLGATPRPRPMEGTTVEFYDIYRTDDLSDTTTFDLIVSAPGDSNRWVDATVTNDQWYYYYIKTHQSHGISDRSTYVWAYPKTDIDSAHVLLVDDDGSSWAGGVDESWAYIQAMLDAEVAFNGYDISWPYGASPELSELTDHDAVIWWTGILASDSTTLSPSDETLIENYLSTGGNFALFSQDYLWDRYNSGFGPSDFPSVELGLDSAVQDYWNISSSEVAALTGTFGGPFDGMNFMISSPFGNFDLWPDLLAGDSALAYINDGSLSGTAICGKKGVGFKTLFSTVPLSALIDTTDPCTKEEFVLRILDDYFGLFGPANVEFEFDIGRGWNMLSVPVQLTDWSPAAVFPGHISPIYRFDPVSTDYTTVDSIVPGEGYFVLYFADTTFSFTAPPVEAVSVDLGRGWNQIGGIYSALSIPFSSAVFTPDMFVTGNFFSWNGADYLAATDFDAGSGYWALTSATCVFSMSSSRCTREDPEPTTIELALDGALLNIGIGEEVTGFMPPAAPTGSGARAWLVEDGEKCLVSVKESGTWTLHIEDDMELTFRNSTTDIFVLTDGGESHEITGSGSVSLKAGDYTISAKSLPTEFALAPAVPNPFNATTAIGFELPRNSEITLDIYDVSGRKVRMLANGEYDAGIYRAVWDGRSDFGAELPSGLYFYRLQTEAGFSQTRRMLLVK